MNNISLVQFTPFQAVFYDSLNSNLIALVCSCSPSVGSS